MATEAEIMKCLMILSRSFPGWNRDMSEEDRRETFRVYVRFLEDLPVKALEAATLQCAADSRFFPVVSELRERVLALTSPRYPTALSAWVQVTQGDKTCRLANEVFAAFKLDRYDLSQMDHHMSSVTRTQFIKEYTRRVAQELAEYRLLPEVRALKASFQPPAQLPAAQAVLDDDRP